MIRFALFVVTSGTSAVINVVTRSWLSLVMTYEAAVALAYVVGMIVAFLLARQFVFRPTLGTAHGQFARFLMVNAIGFAQVWLISVGLVRYVFPSVPWIWDAEVIAHIIALSSLAPTSYLLHKHFSFRET